MTITAVGAGPYNGSRAGGTFTMSVTNNAVGNIMVVWVAQIGFTANINVTGGGVTTWIRAKGVTDSTNTEAAIWYGVITSSGAQTISVAMTGSTGMAIAQEFNSSVAGTWAVDVSGITGAGSTATSGNMTSLTPTGSSELYLGIVEDAGSATATMSGSTSGFVYNYNFGSVGFRYNALTSYYLNAANPTAYSPQWQLNGTTTAGVWVSAAVVLSCNAAPPANNGNFFALMGM